MKDNIILMSDSYKVSHWTLHEEKTEKLFSYLESRGGKYDKTVVFGFQYFIKRYLEGQVVTYEKIAEAKQLINVHMGPNIFNESGWNYIMEEYDGHLPVRIKAVPEGSIVPTSNVLMTIENTDDKCFWLVNYLETLLLQVWYTISVATQSYHMKEDIQRYLNETSDDPINAGIEFKLHNFSYRGVSSHETACMGDVAHLTSFLGSDTMGGLKMAREYYNCDCASYSVVASEHSTITSWGRENECKAFENMLDKHKDVPIIACVSDSYNIYEACDKLWGEKLKDKIMNRNGTLVIRPDSQDPRILIPDMLEILFAKFGGVTNSKGYKVLDSHVRIIQGDGIDSESIVEIMESMKQKGWSIDNIAFGSGGPLCQKLDRDTQKFAFKACAVKVDGQWRDVYKQPIGCDFKASKKGRLDLIKDENGEFKTIRIDEVGCRLSQLETIFENGKVLVNVSLDDVRERISNATV